MANRRKAVLAGSRGSHRTSVTVDYKAMIEAAAQKSEVDVSDWGGAITATELASLLRMSEGTARRILNFGVQERGVRSRQIRVGKARVTSYAAADVYNVVEEMRKRGKLAVKV